MKPKLVREAGAFIICDEWESFAMMGVVTRRPGKRAPQPMIVVAVTGRVNNSTERQTITFAMDPSEAVTFAAGVVHSATHLDGQLLDFDTDQTEPG